MSHGQIAGTGLALFVAALFSFLVWLALHEWEQAKNYRDGNGQAGYQRPKDAPAKRHKHTNHATPEEHQTAEEYQWRFSFIYSVVTTAFAFAAVGISAWTLAETEGKQITLGDSSLQ